MPVAGNINISYPMLLEQENKIKLLEPFTGSKVHTKMQCQVCDHVWTATPISKRQAYKKYGVSGCPNCNINKKNVVYQIKRNAVLDLFAEAGLEILSDYDGSQTTTRLVKFRNINCGHEFETYPGNVLQLGTRCTTCGKLDRTSTITTWSKANSARWKETATEWQKYKAEVSSLTEQTYKLHKKRINPNDLPRGKAGQEGAYHLDHIVPKRFCFDNNIPPTVCADASNLQMIGWRENVGSRNHIKGSIPPVFFQYISTNSKLEQYATTLKQILPTCEAFVNVADIIVTVYDSCTNRAVVVLPTDQSHANMKNGLAAYRAFVSAGISFIILFEDEMEDVALLAAKLKHYTKANNVERIHARNCVIRPCSKEEKKLLLSANHIQGNDNAQIAYGAYHRDQLVAVMTFTAPRVALGQKGHQDRTGVWELSRFCTDVGYRIPGIASKLLNHFKRNHTWGEIYSYADKRWSVGNMYYQLGFELVADNPPDYFYIVDGRRKHRWNYRKDVLKNTLPNYDSNLTEYQNMVNHGYWRVWDCGTLKFSVRNV